jgi:tetratricopeptide (TPR) repeat protein
MKLFYLFLSTIIIGCNQQSETEKKDISPEAIKLNDSAVSIVMRSTENDSVKYSKAIALLDHTTAIDSNYGGAYWNKRAYQAEMGLHEGALISTKQLIRLNPNVPAFYSSAGILSEVTGDTISSIPYFQKAAVLYENVLDTIAPGVDRDMTLVGKGVNLIMLGKEKEGQELIANVYNSQADPQMKEAVRNSIAPSLNKSRKEIISLYREHKKRN